MKYEKMNHYLQEQIGICRASAASLAADHRDDEAVFDKVRLNVYDIFRSLLGAAGKAAGEQGTEDFFLGKMDQITQVWQASLEQAAHHGNEEKAYIERIKLDTAQRVREKFLEIWEAE